MSQKEKIIAIGSLIAIISTFLPWWRWEGYLEMGQSVKESWWFLSFIAALLSFLLVFLPTVNVRIPKFGISEVIIQKILGFIVLVIPLLSLIKGSSAKVSVNGLVSVSPSVGIYTGIIGGLLIIYACYRKKTGYHNK